MAAHAMIDRRINNYKIK